MLSRWLRPEELHRADEHEAEPQAPDNEGDPRGGPQNPEYRTADPRDIVEGDGVAMSGPGGAPQDDREPEAR